jgi:RsiW-degrading membrane proteinase PrsW (M82 family)
MLSVLPIMLLEYILSIFNAPHSSFIASFYGAFVVAAFSEESVKWGLLFWLVWKSREFDQYYDGIVYAVCVSLGFACVENMLYVFQNGYGTAILRAVLSIPIHGFCGVIMGYFFSLAKFSQGKRNYFWLSLVIPVLLHGLFDFLLMYAAAMELPVLLLGLMALVFIIFIIFLWRMGLQNIKEHVARDNYSDCPDDKTSTMESSDHFKNGANPKSHTSRECF